MAIAALTDPGTVVETFSDASQWTKDDAVTTLNPHNRCLDDPLKWGIEMRRALSATPPTVGYIWKTSGISLNLSTMKSLRLDFRMVSNAESPALTTAPVFDISSTTDFSKYMRYEGSYAPTVMGHISPHRLVMPKASFTAVGGESWSNTMVAIRIGLKLYVTSYGLSGAASLFLDKLVKDPVTKPLLLIAVDPTDSNQAPTMIAALESRGYLAKAWVSLVDYDNIGDTGYTTWAVHKQYSDAGLQYNLCQTAWLLRAPYNPVRPVPPYPPEDTTVPSTVSDSLLGLRMSRRAIEEIQARAKAIHDYYGISYSYDILVTHAGSYGFYDFRRWFEDSGYKLYYERADYNPSYGPGQHYASIPVGTSLNTAFVSTAWMSKQDVKNIIDEVCLGAGTYASFNFNTVGSSPGLSQSDFAEVLDYIKAKEQAQLLQVVSPSEFLSLARDVPAAYKGAGQEGSIYLGNLNLNDGANYFVDNEGVNLGQPQARWDEVPSYSGGAAAQVNVQRGGLIAVTLPMRVTADSDSALRSKLAALWAEVDKPTNVLTIGGETYDIGVSTRPETIERDPFYVLGHTARFTLVLTRKP